MSCENVVQEIPGLHSGQIDPSTRAGVQHHLSSCVHCKTEATRMDRLDELLRTHLPTITASPTFASTFANRLAAEIAAEEARAERKGLFGWLGRPWLVPAGALAILIVGALGAMLANRPSPQVATAPRPAPAEKVVVAEAPRAPGKAMARAPKPASVVVAAADVPPALQEEAEPFIDYAIVRQLHELEQLDLIEGAGEPTG
jgi:anti-sigma factor RsiW